MHRCLVILISLVSATAFQQAASRAQPPMTATVPSKPATSWPRQIAASIFLPAVLAGTIVVSPAFAAAADASVFNNEYADPLHPFCDRKIEVAPDGQSFHYSSTDTGSKEETTTTTPQGESSVRRGCSPQEIKLYTLREGSFDGKILDNNRISVGDGIHEGVWEPKDTADTHLGLEDVDGIRWNDGNKWIVKSQSRVLKTNDGTYVVTKKPMSVVIGEFIFYSYLGASTLAGVKGVVDGIQRKREQNA